MYAIVLYYIQMNKIKEERMEKGGKIKPIQIKQLKIMQIEKAKVRATKEQKRRKQYFK